MNRTALLLSALVLGGLLAAPPALATLAAPATAAPVTVAVAKAKASPARQSGDCPTTVGFSAVIAAKGRGVVRYRWVRGDGGKGAVKSFRVDGARRVTVRDRQTFERSVSGWQAVEVLGRAGLSRKAYFSVTCEGAGKLYDVGNPLPASHAGRPVVAAADVDVTPPAYTGQCPTTVRFTATLQVSRTPARVGYQWIDGAGGESRPEYLDFPEGGPRLRQVSLPVTVSGSTSGWKAVRILERAGHDSGRASYAVTCTGTTPPSSPPPTSPPPTSPPPTSPPPTSPPPSSPPPAKPAVPSIVGISPGTYDGSCAEPVRYESLGRLTLPAGAAATLAYQWILDGKDAEGGTVTVPAGAGDRSKDFTTTWTMDRSMEGAHSLGLKVVGGTPVVRTFTFTCRAEPQPPVVTIGEITAPAYAGDCAKVPNHRARAVLGLDRPGEVEYRFVIDKTAFPYKKVTIAGPATVTVESDAWASATGGTVRVEVRNHNAPAKEAPYTVTCAPEPKVTVQADVAKVSTHTDCTRPRTFRATGTVGLNREGAVSYRWAVDGKRTDWTTLTFTAAGEKQVTAHEWQATKSVSGTVSLETKEHNHPAAHKTYTLSCPSAWLTDVKVDPATWSGDCSGKRFVFSAKLHSTRHQDVRVELVQAHNGALIDRSDHKVLAYLPKTVTITRYFNVTLKLDAQLRITSPDEGYRSQILPVDVTCHKVSFSDVKATKMANTCGNWVLSGKITLGAPASLSYRWARKSGFSGWEGEWVTVNAPAGVKEVSKTYTAPSRDNGQFRLEVRTPYETVSSPVGYHSSCSS
ncbi:hypothetical protein [Nonomuraea africana]|uniref:Ig-like domain-containing protein n=1 Tax=Nonomuraea africana TaxID=46171 RepID=A0ABR9K7F6_9ACTN|nr:hypothetical protein [Nonomuraea africana]MBE1557943.1 hypothetical protein [Nonomuraea africana]